jgi:hypothetical protein
VKGVRGLSARAVIPGAASDARTPQSRDFPRAPQTVDCGDGDAWEARRRVRLTHETRMVPAGSDWSGGPARRLEGQRVAKREAPARARRHVLANAVAGHHLRRDPRTSTTGPARIPSRKGRAAYTAFARGCRRAPSPAVPGQRSRRMSWPPRCATEIRAPVNFPAEGGRIA